jgi:hypothetical protein
MVSLEFRANSYRILLEDLINVSTFSLVKWETRTAIERLSIEMKKKVR